MRILFLVLFISNFSLASVESITDKEAGDLLQKYESMYDKKDPKIITEVFSDDFFDEKKETEEFVKNMKEDKTKSKKITWKVSPSNGKTKHLRVNGDKIFVLVKTAKGTRIQRIYEAD